MVQMSAINHISGAQGSAVMCASTPNVISENRLITGNNLEKYFHWPHPSGGATATAAAAGETVQIQAACVAYHWLLQVNQLFLVDSYYIKAGDHGQQGTGHIIDSVLDERPDQSLYIGIHLSKALIFVHTKKTVKFG